MLGVRVDGRLLTYYLIFFAALALFLLMLRVVNSPFGRVLQAIRENAFRAEALGYRTVVYRTLADCIAAAVAALAGVLMAILLRYNGPEATLSFTVMVDILLMVVIGGMGTLYGPALGAAVIVLAQYLSAAWAASGVGRACRGAGAAVAVPSRSLAAVARSAVRADRVFLSGRDHWQPAAAWAVSGCGRGQDFYCVIAISVLA